MIEHLPDVGVTVVSHWIFNCFVIRDGGEGRPLVVDAGLPTTATEVQALLAELPGGEAPVVVATHLHADHVGGVPALAAAGGEVHLGERVRAWRDGEPAVLPGLAALARIGPVLIDQPFEGWTLKELAASSAAIGVDARNGLRLPLEPTGWLADGDTVPGAPDWRVLATGGHTDDSISLWSERHRMLCSGDAVLAVGRRGWFNPELSDPAATAATEVRLRALPVDVLLPGHGRPVAGEVMHHAVSHQDRPPVTARLLTRLRAHARE